MTVEIDPRFEVLFNDLKNHSIEDYLVSRDFKILMSKNDCYTSWQKTYEEIKNNRKIFSLDYDHVRGDNLDTLAAFLNACQKGKNIESIILLIIRGFIDFKKNNEDFTDVIEASIIAKFSTSFIAAIEEEYKIHKKKQLPEKNISSKTHLKKVSISNSKEIFIVHGHNEELKQKIARTIEKLGLKPIILHEQTNKGLTIIEKFEKHSEVGFAIILLTFDDYGYSKLVAEKNKRSRQNVILELGYFIGKLGRDKVMPLYEIGVELPSDISGIVYTPIESNDNWKFMLVKELRGAGYNVDANDLL